MLLHPYNFLESYCEMDAATTITVIAAINNATLNAAKGIVKLCSLEY